MILEGMEKMNFQSITGQNHIVEFLTNSINTGRISHAYLFMGPEGTGKRQTANIFARALNCLSEVQRPCGECSSCRRMGSGNYPDFNLIKPEEDKLTIGIDQIRKLKKDIMLKSFEGGYKIFLIPEGEKVTEPAFNSLLKILEEPPPKSVIILCASGVESILSTVVSRCQLLEFRRVANTEIERVLREEYGCEQDRAQILAGISEGIIGKAIALYEDGDFFSEREGILKSILNASSGRVFEALSAYMDIDKKGTTRENAKAKTIFILNTMETWFRDLLVLRLTKDTSLLVNIDKKDVLKTEVTRFNFNDLVNIVTEISRVNREISRSRVLALNFPLLLDSMVAKLNYVAKE